jgi:hypothetical protein
MTSSNTSPRSTTSVSCPISISSCSSSSTVSQGLGSLNSASTPRGVGYTYLGVPKNHRLSRELSLERLSDSELHREDEEATGLNSSSSSSRATPRTQHKQRLWEELKKQKALMAKLKAELEKMSEGEMRIVVRIYSHFCFVLDFSF